MRSSLQRFATEPGNESKLLKFQSNSKFIRSDHFTAMEVFGSKQCLLDHVFYCGATDRDTLTRVYFRHYMKLHDIMRQQTYRDPVPHIHVSSFL